MTMTSNMITFLNIILYLDFNTNVMKKIEISKFIYCFFSINVCIFINFILFVVRNRIKNLGLLHSRPRENTYKKKYNTVFMNSLNMESQKPHLNHILYLNIHQDSSIYLLHHQFSSSRDLLLVLSSHSNPPSMSHCQNKIY